MFSGGIEWNIGWKWVNAEDSWRICQHKDINKIEKPLNKDFCNIWDWFVDSKLGIPFGEDKTIPTVFASKFSKGET